MESSSRSEEDIRRDDSSLIPGLGLLFMFLAFMTGFTIAVLVVKEHPESLVFMMYGALIYAIFILLLGAVKKWKEEG